MNFSTFLAKKYYFSKSRKSFVNKISFLAVVVIALMVIAEIVVLSVFNGFTDQLKSIHYAFDSDLELKPKTGKVIELSSDQKVKLSKIEGIQVYTEVLEDDAILDYQGSQDIIRFKGVDSNFFDQNLIKEHIEVGDAKVFKVGDIVNSVIGVGVEYKFGINMKSPGFFMLMYPNKNKNRIKKSTGSYQELVVQPRGVFRIEMEYDEKYIIIPIEAARNLTGYKNYSSAIEFKLKPTSNIETVKKSLRKVFGNNVTIEDREERHASIYKAIKIEKLMTYLIFLLVLVIASLNLYAAVSMLVLSKQKDIETLNTMGASVKSIRAIFWKEGGFIISTGIILGSLLAVLLIYLQSTVGLVPVPEPNILITHIPVRLSMFDYLFSILLTFIVSLIMITKPVLTSTKNIK